MIFGRPTMISKESCSAVPRPRMVDDMYLSQDAEGDQPPGCPSQLGLFVMTIELVEILSDILDAFYSDNDSLIK